MVQTVIVVAIRVGAVASFPPSTWRDVENTMRWQVGSIEDARSLFAGEPGPNWVDCQWRRSGAA